MAKAASQAGISFKNVGDLRGSEPHDDLQKVFPGRKSVHPRLYGVTDLATIAFLSSPMKNIQECKAAQGSGRCCTEADRLKAREFESA